MGLTNDRDTVRKEGEYAAYPVKGGAKIYAGGIVCIGTDGYAVPGSDSAGLKLVGISRRSVDNTVGVSGALTVEVWRKGCFSLAASGSMAISNVGDSVYVVDDQTVALTTTNHVKCGAVSEFLSSTSLFVDIDRI